MWDRTNKKRKVPGPAGTGTVIPGMCREKKHIFLKLKSVDKLKGQWTGQKCAGTGIYIYIYLNILVFCYFLHP